MGLFDRMKNDRDEVELRPETSTTATATARRDDTESSNTDSDEFVLPGMAPAKDVDTDETTLERIREQNDRIIELLEALVGDDADDDTGMASIW